MSERVYVRWWKRAKNKISIWHRVSIIGTTTLCGRTVGNAPERTKEELSKSCNVCANSIYA